MATIKSFTDLQQSKVLAEILPLESADMYWWPTSIRYYIEAMDDGDFNEEEGHIRAWSLAALLGILPKGTNISISDILNEVRYSCWNDYGITYADNPVDACVAMIETLHELKIL